jgi:hypothetical protein
MVARLDCAPLTDAWTSDEQASIGLVTRSTPDRDVR